MSFSALELFAGMDLIPIFSTVAAATHDLPLLTTIAAAFAAAWVLGLLTQRLGLSPIVGYLLAGVLIGPHTPGFIGDVGLAQQLAEIGVILLMFGVGLHFHLKDLLAVKYVAVPGAIGQSLVAILATVVALNFFGWDLKTTVVLGMAMAVASTVVLMRVLMDRGMLNTSHGHVAVGWLIVEDIMTVLALVLVPILAKSTLGGADVEGGESAAMTIVWALGKLIALVLIVLLAGSRVVPWILTKVARLRSAELFTLTILVLSVTIAVGSATFFGVSVALGAFLAGMVVAQSPLSQQAAADAMPMRGAFAVLFFVSVGMLFDPAFLFSHPLLVLTGLMIVLVAKPLAALVIVAVLGYPARTGLTVAVGLAQIGEFSFILAQVARDGGLMPVEGTNLLVAVSILSISINPLLFGSLDRLESAARSWPGLWRLLNGRSDRRMAAINAGAQAHQEPDGRSLAIIVGYGPVGRVVDALLRDAGMHTVVIDMNVDTVQSLVKEGRAAIYGDGSQRVVLDQAGLGRAKHLVVSLPRSESLGVLLMAARELSTTVQITVRARYLSDRQRLLALGANRIIYEEGEAGVALARDVMEQRGMDRPTMEKLLLAIRQIWRM